MKIGQPFPVALFPFLCSCHSVYTEHNARDIGCFVRCQEHKSYNKWLGGKAKPCQRDLLRAAIDAALAKKPKDFEEFLKLVEAAGYTVKRGKHVTFMRDGQPQNIRLRSLGEGYSEEELRAVILGTRVHTPRRKKRYPSKVSRPTLISQIEAKIGNGKGAAYDQKLKSMAETLLFIHKAAKKAFDELALKKLPTVKSLQAEYSDLLVQKKLDYAELSKARDEAKRLHIIFCTGQNISG